MLSGGLEPNVNAPCEMPVEARGEPPPDELLIQHVGRGCAECFASLFHRYHRPVYSLALRILRDRVEAEDILQEVFLAVHRQLERYDPERGSVRTWILQFAYFKALLRRRYLRIRRRYQEEEDTAAHQLLTRSATTRRGLNPEERACWLERAMSLVGPKQRRVIELVHFEGYTLRECSELLGESLANTRNYYYRGLRALRTHLQPNSQAEKASESRVTGNIHVCPDQS